MSKPPAFQFYAADFLTGTALMTDEEVGQYIRLLCHQWILGPLPSENPSLSRLLSGGFPKPLVLEKFETTDDGQLLNARLERERIKQIEYREKQAENGKKGGRPKGLANPTLNPTLKGSLTQAERVGVTQTKALLSSSSSSSSVLGFQSSSSSSEVSLDEPSKKFTKPTIEQVRDYCQERGNHVDAERFFDFYESKGWMIGKNKVKDWKACVRTWEKSEPRNGSQSGSHLFRGLQQFVAEAESRKGQP